MFVGSSTSWLTRSLAVMVATSWYPRLTCLLLQTGRRSSPYSRQDTLSQNLSKTWYKIRSYNGWSRYKGTIRVNVWFRGQNRLSFCIKLNQHRFQNRKDRILKRQSHEIFFLYFFMNQTHLGPLINRLIWFCLKIRFRKDIRIQSSKNLTPRRVILRWVENFWQASPLKC